MPVYEYDCARCGEIAAMRPMAARNDPLPCPDCGASLTRVIRSAPAFAGMPAALRTAHATNERAANEPRQSARHGMSCACCSGSRKTAAGGSGLKSFAGTRPWMISH